MQINAMDVGREQVIKGALAVLLLSAIIHYMVYWWLVRNTGYVESPLKEYDYIIVGGGTAGCVLARRLSTDPRNFSVLVVEAGGIAPWVSSVPLLAPVMQKTPADWGYHTVTQKSSQFGMKNQESYWPRGRTLGGSSSINYMVNLWPCRSDLDSWPDLGCEDWSYDELQPYFIKSETFQGNHVKYRGDEGPLPVSEFDGSSSILAQKFLEGAGKLTLPLGDLNGKLEFGAMLCQSNILHGRRRSAFDSYLDPVMGITNLQVMLDSSAFRVTFQGNRTTGVELRQCTTNQKFFVKARREVILSAGVIGSPYILLMSGLGPANHIHEKKIRLVADLPGVGRRLRDHLNVPLYFHLDAPISLTATKAKAFKEIWKHYVYGQGYLSWSGVEAVVRTPNFDSSESQHYFMLFNMGSIDEKLFSKIANLKPEAFHASFPEAHNESKEGFIILMTCAHPKSEGYVELDSSFPMYLPRIDPRYLEEIEDIKCFIKGMKLAAILGTTEPLQKLGSKLHLPNYENCKGYTKSIENDDYLECWLRTGAITGYHPLGTCAMGSPHDTFAVLDTKFRVRKVENLRVVDSSAIPTQISGTPHTLVIAMAEKAADIILDRKRDMYTMND